MIGLGPWYFGQTWKSEVIHSTWKWRKFQWANWRKFHQRVVDYYNTVRKLKDLSAVFTWNQIGLLLRYLHHQLDKKIAISAAQKNETEGASHKKVRPQLDPLANGSNLVLVLAGVSEPSMRCRGSRVWKFKNFSASVKLKVLADTSDFEVMKYVDVTFTQLLTMWKLRIFLPLTFYVKSSSQYEKTCNMKKNSWKRLLV